MNLEDLNTLEAWDSAINGVKGQQKLQNLVAECSKKIFKKKKVVVCNKGLRFNGGVLAPCKMSNIWFLFFPQHSVPFPQPSLDSLSSNTSLLSSFKFFLPHRKPKPLNPNFLKSQTLFFSLSPSLRLNKWNLVMWEWDQE